MTRERAKELSRLFQTSKAPEAVAIEILADIAVHLERLANAAGGEPAQTPKT